MNIYGSEFSFTSSFISSLLDEACTEFDFAAGIAAIDDTAEFLVICKSTIDLVGFGCESNPVATTETLALPSSLSSKIDPTITSASG